VEFPAEKLESDDSVDDDDEENQQENIQKRNHRFEDRIHDDLKTCERNKRAKLDHKLQSTV